ncbi:MAG: tetratricopeptide repeat protein [Chloroflexi bacterium]|nr:tetratricopeptide repeat protein [Chloroflexota bacterium]
MENPAAYIPLDRRRALAAGANLPIHTTGAALFADISGFTPLTESLAQAYGPRRGADELTRHLNEVYSAIIAPVHAFGGAVIGFSGDAISCWFDDSDTPAAGLLRACAAALEMQRAVTAFARLDYPGGQLSLAIKTVVAAGPIQRHRVGDPNSRLIDVLAGGLLERMSEAEQAAGQGELLLDEASACGWVEWLIGGWVERNASRFLRVQALAADLLPQEQEEPISLPEHLVRPWLLSPVYARIRSQQGRFLAELRPAAALFLKFAGLDFEANPEAGEQLDRYIRWVQSVVDRFEGSLIQLTTGDKGSYLYAAFGAPVAHDDDAQRAVSAALALADSPNRFSFIRAVQMGISHGRMRVGAYGSESRRTYGVLGDETNVAARLMSKAEAGQILVSQRVAELVGERFQLRALGAMRFKGKSEPLPVFAVEGERTLSGDEYRSLFPGRLEGRTAELAQMQRVLADVLDGRGRLLRVQGEAGVGKSHLAAVFLEESQRQGAQAAVGACQSTGRDVAYGSVGTIARQLLGLAGQEGRSAAAQIDHLQATLSALNPEWLLRLPLLGDLLRLPIPDNPTTAAFTPQLRQEALIALALEIVQLRARQRPLLLLIEDLHWIDEASGRLVLALARVIRESQILLLLLHRPQGADGAAPALGELLALAEESVVELAELPPEGVVGLVSNRLGGPVDDLALALIQMQAQGNAFFTEELVDALAESRLLVQGAEGWSLAPHLLAQLQEDGCVQRVGGRWRLLADAPLSAVSLGMPDTIHGAILSRLDRLLEDSKLTLKLASVIGRVFELALLVGIHPGAPTFAELLEQIETLSRRDFARLERPQPQITYIFKHNITQEVVYKTLLESQQREVHTAVAERLENIDPQAIERLAFHYRHGDLSLPSVRGKALHYLDAAGERAKREYANETALGYVERALALETSWERQTAKVDLLHILGRREEEQIALDRLDGLPGVPPLDVQLLWGQYHEAMSDYPAALAAMDAAAHSARQAADSRGLIRVLGRTGLIHWRQGNYTESAAVYGQALALLAGSSAPQPPILGKSSDWAAEEAEIRYGLGILHRQQGKFAEAQAELEAALALARQLENRPDEAKTLAALATVAHLLSDYTAARAYNQRALEIRRSVGDRAGEGASLLALGQSSRALGLYDKALVLFQEALAIQQALGNRWWEAIARNELGIVQMLLGQYEPAQTVLRIALAIVREIEAEVGAAYIQVNLGQILRDTGDLAGADAAFANGLEFAVRRQDRHLEAICYSDSALLRILQDDYAQAMDAAQRAQALYAEIGTPYSATADFTTLARAALALGYLIEAAAYADRTIALLIECKGDGPDFPHRDYWYCAQVLQAVGRAADAESARSVAHRLLREKAEKIADPVLRASFLENVSFNREIWSNASC